MDLENRLWLPRKERREWEGLGAWGKQMQNVPFEMDQQWDPAVQDWELCLDNYDGICNVKKKNVYMYV